MEYKYELNEASIQQAADLTEFANGGAQATVKTKDGEEYPGVLISTRRYIIAIRGFMDLPFSSDDIESIYQTDEDKNPKEKGGWHYWDNWK